MQHNILNNCTKQCIHSERFLLRPMSTSELARVYGIAPLTLKRWIKPFNDKVGEKIGRYYTIKQVKIIVLQLGFPEFITES